MQPEDHPRTVAGGAGQDTGEASITGQEQYQAVRRAVADALQLARLQAEVLTRLDQADQAGDDEAVLRCHAELDHIMARMAEAERVRTGAQAVPPGQNDLACAGCGAAAEPVYDTPRLLGYRCAHCGWSGDDPAAQAERRRAAANDAARAAVDRAVKVLGDALVTLEQRRKKAREEGIAALRALHGDLTGVGTRLRKTESPAER